MPTELNGNLEQLLYAGCLSTKIILWGVGYRTDGLLAWLSEHEIRIGYIVDNFKCTYLKEYKGIPVYEPERLQTEKGQFAVLLAINYANAVLKQLHAYGVTNIYNLCNLKETYHEDNDKIPYQFEDRKRDKSVLCYILAGYQEFLWDNVLTRIKKYESKSIDYCIVTSGKYSERLAQIARDYGWSYLATEVNQVAYIQNLVIELHPNADRFFKFDEDIFISRGFFEDMLAAMEKVEQKGEYRIGFMVPVIPLNCAGYVSYLNGIGKKEEYEQRFGRAYRGRYSAVFNVPEAAEYMWSTMKQFDETAEYFRRQKGYERCDCYYNIGCILYTRKRWLMMGKWPVVPNTAGMGVDEDTILKDNAEKDFVIYEVQNVLAGHFAFGHQKKRMEEFYNEHRKIFDIR